MSHPKSTVACLLFGFNFFGMNVNERERRAKNSSFGQIIVRLNSQKIELVILPRSKVLEMVERLKILTESKTGYHVYSSMHTIESLLLGFVYCMEHLPFENYLVYMVLVSGKLDLPVES